MSHFTGNPTSDKVHESYQNEITFKYHCFIYKKSLDGIPN